jgi:hypothetical protein
MGELSDHLEDVKEDGMEAVSRLGDPEQVADDAVTAYKRRSFLGRHPVAAFLVFAISPVIPWFFVWVVLGCVAHNLNTSGAGGDTWFIEHHWLCSLMFAVCSTIAGTLYGELAMWLGIGRKWTLASYAAIGGIAMLCESDSRLSIMPVMLLVQFAVPFAVGWWSIKRKYEQKYAATKVLVFVVSPVVLLMILSCVVSLAMRPVTEWVMGSQAVKRLSPAVFDAVFYSAYLLRHVIPTAVAGLLYCTLTKRFGLGGNWIFISCTVIVTFEAMKLFDFAMEMSRQHILSIPLTLCDILAGFLVPLAIGWWFMRRKREQGQLQLAA